MLQFMIAGGFGMWFVLIFGLLALGAATLFAIRPDPRKVDMVNALTRATVFSLLAGMVAGFAAMGVKIPERWPDHPKIHLLVLEGVGESVLSGVLGFSLLSITWLVMAVGHRRLARELP